MTWLRAMSITVSTPPAAPRPSAAMKDLIAGAIAFAALLLAFVSVDFIEMIFAATREHEDWELDEILAAIPPLVLVAAWFSYRRWREVAELNQTLNRTVGELEAANALRQRMERQLRESQKLEAMGKLSGGLAHELNNVLQPIVTLAQHSADRDDISAELKARMAHILAAASHGSDIVRDVLTFASGGVREPECLDPALALADIVAFSGESLADTVTIETRLADDAGLVSLNHVELTQVITNLLTNAADAMGHRGRISVELAPCHLNAASATFKGLEAGDYIRITVADQGPGIAPDAMGRVFDPFFTTKDAGEGTGLGLAVVHGLVRGWGGSIAVTSSVGAGAAFEILVPRLECELGREA